MKKKQPLEVVSDTAHDLADDIRVDLANLRDDAVRLATEYLAPRARDLADYIGPRVKEAADNVADYAVPRAQDLGRRGAQFASDVKDNLQPKLSQLANDARDTIQPRLASFAEDVSPFVDQARDRLQPHLDDAYARVAPLVETGRERFAEDVLPHLTEALDSINARPETQEAKDRLTAARAALAGDLKLPEEPAKRSFFGTFLRIVLAVGLLAGVAYAVKRFLAPEESGWQAHEPSPAYRRPEAFEDAFLGAEDADADEDASEAAEPEAEAEAVAESSSAWGPGSYVGDDPAEEFFIKGNDRSMKYHVKGSGGFERTIADVWFNSEEAAQAAGFTRAQR